MQNKILTWECPICKKIIQSIYKKQFDHNKKKHQSKHKGGKKMNKKIPLVLLGVVLLAGIVTAGYVVITSTVNVSVKEAFTNEYAVSSDNLGIDCSAVVDWLPLESTIELGELYPLDTRDICVKVSNEAPNDLDYATLVGSELDLVATVGLTAGGTEVTALGSSIDEVVITMNDDAPVDDYGLSVEVTRG